MQHLTRSLVRNFVWQAHVDGAPPKRTGQAKALLQMLDWIWICLFPNAWGSLWPDSGLTVSVIPWLSYGNQESVTQYRNPKVEAGAIFCKFLQPHGPKWRGHQVMLEGCKRKVAFSCSVVGGWGWSHSIGYRGSAP